MSNQQTHVSGKDQSNVFLDTKIYPQYFRKAGRCIRQDSATTTWTIGLPPEFTVPVRFPTMHPSPERLQEELRGYEPSDAATFKSFLCTFYQGVAQERDVFNTAKSNV